MIWLWFKKKKKKNCRLNATSALKTTTMEVEPSTEPSGPWLSLSPWSFSSPTLLSKCSSRRPDSGRWLRDWAEAPAPPVGSWQQPIAAGLKGTGWWSGGGGRERQRGREGERRAGAEPNKLTSDSAKTGPAVTTRVRPVAFGTRRVRLYARI